MQDVDTVETSNYNKRLKKAFNNAMTAEGWERVGDGYRLGNNGFSISVHMTEEGGIAGDMTIQPSEGEPITVSGLGPDTQAVFRQMSDGYAAECNNRNASSHENAPKM